MLLASCPCPPSANSALFHLGVIVWVASLPSGVGPSWCLITCHMLQGLGGAVKRARSQDTNLSSVLHL